MLHGSSFKPNLLTIIPPYAVWGPPAGAAALLAYLKASGCRDFSFLDLRLFAPDVSTPTYRMIGSFGESFVLDIPDLPLALALLDRFRRDEDLLDLPEEVVERYCIERGMNSLHLRDYLCRVGRLVKSVFSQLPELHFVGFSVWTSNYLTTLLAAAYLKRRPHPPFIVAGGPQVSQSTASAQLALRAGLFDAVAVGEGEQTLLDLYSHYSQGRRAVDGPVAGTVTYDPVSQTFPNADRALLRLKELPLPDFDEMHLPAYSIAGKRVVSYQLSRGCTDKCSFCSEWVFWRHFRLSSMDKAVADVAELKRRWGAEMVWFSDSLLNGQMNRLREFAEGLLSHGVEIDWCGYMRAQIDLPTAQLLRRAGCSWVFIGVESLADETLKLMNKRMDERQNLAAVQAFLDAGIRVKVGLIPGFPGDTRERFIRTAKALRGMQAASARLAVSHEAFVVLPGQPIYEQMEQYGLRPVPWPDDILEIAPGLADIARKVWCRVEGDNQGLDRLGEYMISLSLTGPAQPADDDAGERREAITPYELHMSPAGKGVWLGRTVSPGGHLVGAILTEDEHSWFLTNAETDEARPTPLCETRSLGAKLRDILSQHESAVPLQEPPARPMKYRRLTPPFPASARLVLGPLTVARRLGETLWLANLNTGRAGSLPVADETAESLLAGREPALAAGGVTLAELGLLVYSELPDEVDVTRSPLPTPATHAIRPLPVVGS
jgi:radical SAM superfamily enzyme YgiQ (UPF0313 family)